MYELYWHVHHQKLVEFLTEPIENRINYIKASKATNEKFLRLALMRPVKNIPQEAKPVVEALNKAQRVWNAFSKRSGGFLDAGVAAKAQAALVNAVSDLTSELGKPYWELWHKSDCDPYCPWNSSQKTIFPK